MPSSAPATAELLATLLADQQATSTTLSDSGSSLATLLADQQATSTILSDSGRTAAIIERLQTLPSPVIDPPAETAVQQVFGNSDLVENILSNLEVRELFRCHGISKSIHETLNESPVLQKKMFLKPDLQADFTFATTADFPHLECICDEGTNLVSLDYGMRVSDPDLPIFGCAKLHEHSSRVSMGSNVRRMLLTQPPVSEVTFATDCCMGADEVFRPGRHVTIQDVYDKGCELMTKHEFCPRYWHNFGQNPVGRHRMNLQANVFIEIPDDVDDPRYAERLTREEAQWRRDDLWEEETMMTWHPMWDEFKRVIDECEFRRYGGGCCVATLTVNSD